MSTKPQFDLLVHATHEAGVKVGGIGAVLDGLLGARAYTEAIARTILVGPMDTGHAEEMARLAAPRNRLDIRYSSYHNVDLLDASLSERLRAVESRYNARILYGTRAFGGATSGDATPGAVRHEVILVDGWRVWFELVNDYKARLYERFGIQSDRYEHNSEYSLYINMAEPAYRALEAIAGDAGPRRFMIAHEFMGLPLCYSAMLDDVKKYRTIFYGHEVTTVRPIVEFHPGHDTMFYNVMAQARREGRYLEDVFGDQAGFFKHGLIRPAATHCDNILAVGDPVVEEMRFLGTDWASANIDLVYNGVPSAEITLDDKKKAKEKLGQYCINLFGYRPDYVFTHVTRLIPSKGLWRDLRVMEHLDGMLAGQGKTAVLLVLSSTIPIGRPPKAVLAMEAAYGWPVTHREATVCVDGVDVPDLVAYETPFYYAAERFNWTAKASRIILINQFGWSQDRCGRRMPTDMEFIDLRHGSNLEFGQSIYEPFGIAQVEPLSFGALCVVSNVCGCVGFVNRAGSQNKPNVIVANYTEAGESGSSVAAALLIDQLRRDQIESAQAGIVARQIIERLPGDDAAAQKLLEDGFALSRNMSWEVVVRDYLLPSLA